MDSAKQIHLGIRRKDIGIDYLKDFSKHAHMFHTTQDENW